MKNTTTNTQNNELVNNIFTDIKQIARGQKSQKLSSLEVEKFVKYVPSDVRTNVLIKLNENGLITKSSKCDSILLQTIKRDIDENLLSSLQKHGSYTLTIDNKQLLDKIINDPTDNTSSRLFVEADSKNELGKYEYYNPTINNSNEYNRRLSALAKKHIDEKGAIIENKKK